MRRRKTWVSIFIDHVTRDYISYRSKFIDDQRSNSGTRVVVQRVVTEDTANDPRLASRNCLI